MGRRLKGSLRATENVDVHDIPGRDLSDIFRAVTVDTRHIYQQLIPKDN